MGLRILKKQQAAEPVAPVTPDQVDVARFEHLLERYRRQIYAYVYRLVRDSHLAEDIAQETFVRLYREIASIRDETASSWLYRVARNLVTDFKRKKAPVLFTVLGGNRSSDDDEGRESIQFEGREPSPVEQSWGNELSGIIQGVLDRMSPKYRDPLILCDIEQLTYEQASQVLGCSVKTVSARLHRARDFVAGCLKKHIDP
jgi:RNA polymerase sigma factor (sigma-70 family)